jgi:hemerythrin-like domain-containing protein
MTTATDILRSEHVLVLEALDVLERAAWASQHGAAPSEEWWRALLAWLRTFADRNHHAKEERALFPALAQAGVPAGEGGPIGVMLEEHVEGRGLIAAMEAPHPGARAIAAQAYVGLLRAHIEKENGVLFPLADAVLDEDAQRALSRQFEALAAEVGRAAALADAQATLEALATSLAEAVHPA